MASESKLSEELEGPKDLEANLSPISKSQQSSPPEEKEWVQCRCTICGLEFDRLDMLLFHMEQTHPTKRADINRLRLRLLRSAFDPKGYRRRIADEEAGPSSSESK